MATKGGSGTFLRPPGDDDVAPVIPLRQRHSEPSEPSTPRKPLPRERAPFDPELEPGDVALRRRRPPRATLGRVRQATGRLHLRPRLTVALLAAIATAGIAAAGILGPQPFTSPGARHTSTTAPHPTTAGVQAQMAEASADRSRYLLTRRAAATHRAPPKHHRGRTRATTRRARTAARHRSNPNGHTAPTTAAHSSAPVTGQAAALSDPQSTPASSPSAGAGSAAGATSARSTSNGSSADQSPKLAPGPTGVGSANGCDPKCS
jgi:hypothetical protein